MTVRLSGRVPNTIADGPGLRYAVYAQGCNLFCQGCHNPGTHDIDGGEEISVDLIASEMAADPLLDGLTLTGGEPFLQAEPLTVLAQAARALGLNVWIYSGYTYEQIIQDDAKRVLLQQADVLVDGPFVLAQRSLGTDWRGSKNQRILDVKASMAAGEAVGYGGV